MTELDQKCAEIRNALQVIHGIAFVVNVREETSAKTYSDMLIVMKRVDQISEALIAAFKLVSDAEIEAAKVAEIERKNV